jgi:hypothetical protein
MNLLIFDARWWQISVRTGGSIREERLAEFIVVMRDTGMRNARELYCMRVENVDFDAGTVDLVCDGDGSKLSPCGSNVDAGGEFTRHRIGAPRSGSSASRQAAFRLPRMRFARGCLQLVGGVARRGQSGRTTRTTLPLVDGSEDVARLR